MKAFLIFVVAFTLLVGGVYLLAVQPGPSGVAASLRLPDGSEYMVTQKCNFSVEPYTVEFYMHSPGKPWGWCYLDHQANRWWNVALTYDATKDVVTVTEAGTWQAALNRRTGTFLSGNGRPDPSREGLAPQAENVPPPFAFPEP